MANNASPRSTRIPFSTNTPTTVPGMPELMWFMSFITSTMARVLPDSTSSPTSANGGAPGCGDRQKIPGDGETTACAPAGMTAALAGWTSAESSAVADSRVVLRGRGGRAWRGRRCGARPTVCGCDGEVDAERARADVDLGPVGAIEGVDDCLDHIQVTAHLGTIRDPCIDLEPATYRTIDPVLVATVGSVSCAYIDRRPIRTSPTI